MQRINQHPVSLIGASRVQAACLCMLMALIVLGCSAERRAALRKGYGRVISPAPPAFLTGPAALLLTNVPGFSARVEIQAESSLGSPKATTGQLLGRGGKLLYAPESEETTDTHRRPGEYSFIWDVPAHQGYVLSEALQGYAPINSALSITNIETTAGKGAPQRVGGHPCEPVTVSMQSSDGPPALLQVFRAVDLNGFPLRIESETNITFVINLSKLRLEAPAADIFSPPEGFTKYSNPEAMADELAARQHNLRRRTSPQFDPMIDLQQRRY